MIVRGADGFEARIPPDAGLHMKERGERRFFKVRHIHAASIEVDVRGHLGKQTGRVVPERHGDVAVVALIDHRHVVQKIDDTDAAGHCHLARPERRQVTVA